MIIKETMELIVDIIIYLEFSKYTATSSVICRIVHIKDNFFGHVQEIGVYNYLRVICHFKQLST